MVDQGEVEKQGIWKKGKTLVEALQVGAADQLLQVLELMGITVSSRHQQRQNDHRPIQAHVSTKQPHVICRAFRSIPERIELKAVQGRSSEFSLRPDVRQPVHHLELIGLTVRSNWGNCKFQGEVLSFFLLAFIINRHCPDTS